MSKRQYVLLLAVIALALANIVTLSDMCIYHGLNSGIAWDWGGVEAIGEPGIFLCEYDYKSQWHNPLADIWSDLVVDC